MSCLWGYLVSYLQGILEIIRGEFQNIDVKVSKI